MIQNIFTILKVAAIGCDHCFGILVRKRKAPIISFRSGELPLPFSACRSGIAMIATLWSYDGWNSLTYLAGEVIEPQKNNSRALLLELVAVIVIYVTTNLAYCTILPIGQIATIKISCRRCDERCLLRLGRRNYFSDGDDSLHLERLTQRSMTTARRVLRYGRKIKCSLKKWEEVHSKFRTPAKSLVIQGHLVASILCF